MNGSGSDDSERYIPTERMTRAWLERLRSSASRQDVMESALDLRDNAYDLPDAWRRFTVVRFLTFLCDMVEDAADDATNWDYFGSLLGDAISKARSDASTNWDG